MACPAARVRVVGERHAEQVLDTGARAGRRRDNRACATAGSGWRVAPTCARRYRRRLSRTWHSPGYPRPASSPQPATQRHSQFLGFVRERAPIVRVDDAHNRAGPDPGAGSSRVCTSRDSEAAEEGIDPGGHSGTLPEISLVASLNQLARNAGMARPSQKHERQLHHYRQHIGAHRQLALGRVAVNHRMQVAEKSGEGDAEPHEER